MRSLGAAPQRCPNLRHEGVPLSKPRRNIRFRIYRRRGNNMKRLAFAAVVGTAVNASAA